MSAYVIATAKATEMLTTYNVVLVCKPEILKENLSNSLELSYVFVPYLFDHEVLFDIDHHLLVASQ